ncbi:type IV pilus modification protein PilV [Sedimenticola selenatireducens]|uniref:type IV pilus modification protein PilV n=1 Tax=Sedimenticola selenatireducens TaxID=191960 RepID=UPI002AAB4911|nr:type IV pilus modification protein PilV [Sedimenticola selenatireducens]
MKQNGFTLVEILVAVLVLSLGLLGVAGMQVMSVKNSNSAYQRAQATQLSYDIIDRMRANRDEAEKTGSGYVVAFGGSYSASSACETGNCSPASMATYDIANWKTTLAATLPGGDGSVAINTASKMVTINIRWDDLLVKLVSGEQIQSREPLTLTFRTEL